MTSALCACGWHPWGTCRRARGHSRNRSTALPALRNLPAHQGSQPGRGCGPQSVVAAGSLRAWGHEGAFPRTYRLGPGRGQGPRRLLMAQLRPESHGRPCRCGWGVWQVTSGAAARAQGPAGNPLASGTGRGWGCGRSRRRFGGASPKHLVTRSVTGCGGGRRGRQAPRTGGAALPRHPGDHGCQDQSRAKPAEEATGPMAAQIAPTGCPSSVCKCRSDPTLTFLCMVPRKTHLRCQQPESWGGWQALIPPGRNQPGLCGWLCDGPEGPQGLLQHAGGTHTADPRSCPAHTP